MANIAINAVATRVQYTASGGQTVFSYTFPIKANTDLKVYKRAAADDPDDSADLLTLTTDYTVTGANTANGGTVVLVVAATAGDIVTIVGDKPIDRTAIYEQSVTLKKADLNNDFNNTVMYEKQTETILNQLTPKYQRSELVSESVRPNKLKLPILNDGETWVGRGNSGDSPDDIIAATAFPEELLEVDFIIGTADGNLPNAQVLGSLGSGFLANVDGGATGTLVSRSLSGTANEIDLTNGTGGGNVVVGLADNLIMPGTAGCEFPKGTTAQRPGGPADGATRWNTDLQTWEGWDGTTWVDFFTTSTGANTALSNLAAVAINTSLISDTDATDNLGSQAIRWANIYATSLQTGDTAGDLLRIGAWDTNGGGFTPFITITANNTPTCVLADGVEGVTQAPGDSSDLLATTQYVDDAVSAAGANTALSNLAAVAINTSLVSDSDGVDDLGSESNRWFNLYAERITTGQSAADALNIGAWDVNGAAFTPFITLTANNTPTCLLQDGVEAVTQAPGDNSQKVATTEYCEDYLPLAGGTMTGDLILNADPTVALGAVTKQYVDAIAAGIDIKDPAYAATTGALTATYLNGVSGVGATLTNSGAQAAFSVDGVSPPINSRILVKNQGSTFENGIYTLTVVGTGATNWVLTRATDYDQVAEISTGDLVIVENGTLNAITSWLQTATVATIGVDAITFAQFSGAAAGANTALSNLAAVAINTSLISDTDITDDLGSLAIRWKDIFAQALNTGDTNADTLKIRGYDVDGASYVDFLTVTAGNTPTCVLASSVTGTTQAANDNSTKLATTAYADAAAAGGGGGGAFMGAVSTNWYPSGQLMGQFSSTNGQRSTATGTIYYVPFFVGKSTTFTDIGNLIGTTAAGNSNLCLYNDSGAGKPTGNPIANSTSGSLANTISTFNSFTFSSPITLTAGLYWAAFTLSGTSTVYGNAAAMGRSTGLGLNGTPSAALIATPVIGWSESFVYNTTMPTVGGSLTAVLLNGTGDGFVFLKAQ